MLCSIDTKSGSICIHSTHLIIPLKLLFLAILHKNIPIFSNGVGVIYKVWEYSAQTYQTQLLDFNETFIDHLNNVSNK